MSQWGDNDLVVQTGNVFSLKNNEVNKKHQLIFIKDTTSIYEVETSVLLSTTLMFFLGRVMKKKIAIVILICVTVLEVSWKKTVMFW